MTKMRRERSEVELDEVQISVHPGVDPREVRPSTFHSEAGDAHHAPPVTKMISEERTTRVSITSVSSSLGMFDHSTDGEVLVVSLVPDVVLPQPHSPGVPGAGE